MGEKRASAQLLEWPGDLRGHDIEPPRHAIEKWRTLNGNAVARRCPVAKLGRERHRYNRRRSEATFLKLSSTCCCGGFVLDPITSVVVTSLFIMVQFGASFIRNVAS